MFTPTEFDGLWVIAPKVFNDARGYFYESFNQQVFEKETGIKVAFVQDNQSLSSYGVLRGLHLQFGAYAQAKLVRVLSGEILDIVVDVRPDSPTFGKSFSLVLSATNKKQLFIPRGFAHGFVVVSETAEFFYKCDNFYAPKHEGGILFDDAELDIDWGLDKSQLIVSERDKKLPTFREFKEKLLYEQALV